MSRCDRMVDVGRRKFMSGAGLAAAGVAVTSIVPTTSKAAPPAARVSYPANRLANVADLKVNEPLNVSYPDDNAPGVLLKLGTFLPSPPASRAKPSRITTAITALRIRKPEVRR